MSYDNSCRFTGRLGKNPDLQYTPSGTAIINVGIAVKGRKKEGDEWVDETTWVDLSFFGRHAETLHKLANQGDLIGVNCEYQKRPYTTPEGEKKARHNFIVREWRFLARKLGVDGVETMESDDFTPQEELPF